MERPYIIAIDFDGTLVTDKFPEIGEPTHLFESVRIWQSIGTKVILWTCRNGEHLEKAVKFCKEQGIEFDAVNMNIPEIIEEYGGDTRKVFADIYIDDKAAFPEPETFTRLGDELENAIRKINSEKNNKLDKQPRRRNSRKRNG